MIPNVWINDDLLNRLKDRFKDNCSAEERQRGVSDETLSERSSRVSSSPSPPPRQPIGDCIRTVEDLERLFGRRMGPSPALARSLALARDQTEASCRPSEIRNNESDETLRERRPLI